MSPIWSSFLRQGVSDHGTPQRGRVQYADRALRASFQQMDAEHTRSLRQSSRPPIGSRPDLHNDQLGWKKSYAHESVEEAEACRPCCPIVPMPNFTCCGSVRRSRARRRGARPGSMRGRSTRCAPKIARSRTSSRNSRRAYYRGLGARSISRSRGANTPTKATRNAATENSLPVELEDPVTGGA